MNENHRRKVSRNKVKAIVFAVAIVLVVALDFGDASPCSHVRLLI